MEILSTLSRIISCLQVCKLCQSVSGGVALRGKGRGGGEGLSVINSKHKLDK